MKIHAEARRDGKWWLVHVPEVNRSTQAHNLAEVPVMAAELASLMLGKGVERGDVIVSVELPTGVQERLAEAARLCTQAAEANHAAAAASREAARQLRAEGMTVRDIGKALDVSYQRAHQLLSS